MRGWSDERRRVPQIDTWDAPTRAPPYVIQPHCRDPLLASARAPIREGRWRQQAPFTLLLCTTARNQLPTTHLIPYDICSLRLFVSDLDIPSIPTGTASPDLSPAHAAQQEKLRESGAQLSSLSRNSQLRQQISLHARPSAADADRQRIFQALKKPRLRSERRLLA